MEQDGLEEGTKGFSTWLLKRKVRKLIKAVDILEERLDNVNVTLVMYMADLEVNKVSHRLFSGMCQRGRQGGRTPSPGFGRSEGAALIQAPPDF